MITRWQYRPTPRSTHYARLALRRVLLAVGLAPLVADVELAASELMANAFLHGTGPAVLTLRISQEYVVIEVADKSPFAPEIPQYVPEHQENGRGMLITMAICDDLGITARKRTSGKVIWARFSIARYQEAVPA